MALPCGHNVLIVTFAIINVVVLHLCVCFSSVFVLVVVLIIVFLL